MGFLTDPSASPALLVKRMLKVEMQVLPAGYSVSITLFFILTAFSMHNNVYFSENALLPHLVSFQFVNSRDTYRYNTQLEEAIKDSDDAFHPWLITRMQRIGLETYIHNFTLNYPLRNVSYTGKNVYGILRAPRAASTEALVLSVPYRPTKSVNGKTSPSLAYMLAFARHAYKAKYWAKDIIFLVTEHEQLGMQAWLEAYHGVTCGTEGVLDHGDLEGRAGAIQAAINLEFHELHVGQIEVKIEGLNGQLPNLDLYNLVSRLGIRLHIRTTFKGRSAHDRTDDEIMDNIGTLTNMVFAQAPGIPTGNHGLFLRFGIQALTMEGFPPKRFYPATAYVQNTQQVIEGTFRSLNNLLEKFHQSFFFYLIVGPIKFVSIAYYIPGVCIMAAVLFYKVAIKWFLLHMVGDSSSDERPKMEDPDLGSGIKPKNNTMKQWKELYEKECGKIYKIHENKLTIYPAFVGFLIAHIFGLIARYIPRTMVTIGTKYGYPTEVSLFYGLALYSAALLVLPVVFIKVNYRTMILFNIFALLELGCAILSIGMFNPSLAMVIGVYAVPTAYLLLPSEKKFKSILSKIFFLLAHPLIIVNIAVFIFTYYNFPNTPVSELLKRSITATQSAIVFSVVDAEIYGNWLYSIVSIILFSNWLCFWCCCFSGPTSKSSVALDKDKSSSKDIATQKTQPATKKEALETSKKSSTITSPEKGTLSLRSGSKLTKPSPSAKTLLAKKATLQKGPTKKTSSKDKVD